MPPIPDQRRCYEVGQALGDIIRNDLPSGMRVGLFGSGGLSHEPGGKRYFYIDEAFDRIDHEVPLAPAGQALLARQHELYGAVLRRWLQLRAV